MILQPTHPADTKSFEESRRFRTPSTVVKSGIVERAVDRCPFLRQRQSAFGTGDGSRITRRRSPRALKEVSRTRLVSVGYRARQSFIDCPHHASVISYSCCSANSPETRQGLLRPVYCARCLRDPGGRRRIVHPAGRRHEPVAGAITHQELQVVDANCVSAVVGGPFLGCGNVRPLVRSAYLPEIIDKRPWRYKCPLILTPG